MYSGKPFPIFILLRLCILGAALATACFSNATAAPAPRPEANPAAYALSPADHALLEEIERAGFQFFLEQSHPVTGLVFDRVKADGAENKGKASIAVSGFAFPAWVIAVERGWVARTEAVERVRAKLRFLTTRTPRQHGFFYHFMEIDTGARAWKCELSSIDSAILFAGAIVAREYFADPEITSLVDALLAEVDWNWFRNGGDLVALAWHDETGFARYRWNKYSEHVLMSFLALGSSPRPLEAGYWNLWHRYPLGRYGDLVYLQEPPLFVNQFPQAFMDVRGHRDAFANYFHNTRLATLAQRQFSLDLRSEFPAWGENLWGLTASDSVTGYKAWGGPPRTLRYNALDGSVVPCAAAGSLPFAPQETLAVLHHMRNAYGDRIWKRYGFVDAFNPHTGWVNSDVLGIDVGISVVQAENVRTGLIQRLFMQSPEAKLALAKAGLLSVSRELATDQQQQLLTHARASWALLQQEPAEPGLQLTALIAAQQLGLITGNALMSTAQALLAKPAPAASAATYYAAALITLRQAVPALATEASRHLDAIAWKELPAAASHLGAASRLTLFLQIAAGVRPSTDWTALTRHTETLGPVQVLSPIDVAGASIPALWLDEHSILSGAAAAQLAYASLSGSNVPTHSLLPVLQLEQFPSEVLRPSSPIAVPASSEAAAATVITAANLLGQDALRRAFQQDPLVQAGRKAIAEFSEASFGPNTSVIAQRELSGVPPPRASREAFAVASTAPRDQWDWQTIEGMKYKESEADVRPEDPPLSFRFAVTWDQKALYFHAVVTDALPGYVIPPDRNRLMELYVDPGSDGMIWTGPHDYQFTYRLGVGAKELFNHAPTEAVITETVHGYTVEASIPWQGIGITPRPGLQLSLSPAAVSEGIREWEATLKLSWSQARIRPGESRLGIIRLK